MANLNLSQFTEKTLVADADWVFVWDTVGAISKKVSRNSLLNSGTLATSSPVTISQTWADVAQTFKALVVNAAGTSAANSAAGSLLLDLQVGTVTQFNVTKAGVITLNDSFSLRSNGGWLELGGKANVLAGTSKIAIWSGESGLVQLANNTVFSWSSLSSAANGSTDLILARDAANTLALRNSTAAQTFNVYGTYTSGTSYERLTLSAPSAANAIIGTNKGSGGGTARGLDLHTDGAARMTIGTTGNVGIGTTAPAAPLDIFKSAAGADATGGGLMALRATAAGDYRGGAIYSRFISGGSADFLVFGVTGVSGKNPYTDFDQARMVIGHTGNVGIGTTAPSSKLQVTGGDVEIETVTSGIIMKAAGTSTRYRITLNATGDALVFTAV